ncbi:hypothetical protein [Sulfurovum sp.]|uniref:hypothetical protein n=1 Tax=Sulfurovum sp. TaxID=1969726 RepID=UPI003562DFF2
MSNNNENKYLTEGLIIGGLTLLSYLVTFAYQSGYAIYFDIPIQLISINLTTILLSCAALLGGAYFVYVLSNFIWMFTPKEDDPISFTIRRYIKIVIICLISLAPFIFQWVAWVVFLSALVFFAFFEFIFPLITQREKETYAEKLKSQTELDINTGKHMLWHEVDKRLGRWLVTSLVYGYIALVFAYNIGTQRAEMKEYFYKIGNNTIVLAFYDDHIVTTTYDEKTKEFSGKLNIYGLDKNIKLSKEKVGRLKKPEKK